MVTFPCLIFESLNQAAKQQCVVSKRSKVSSEAIRGTLFSHTRTLRTEENWLYLPKLRKSVISHECGLFIGQWASFECNHI